MTGLGQSAFLQALGWATLNSIWQMALLWCCFLGANYLFRLAAEKKYLLSVTALVCGSLWFIITFILSYTGKFSNGITFSHNYTYTLDGFLPAILTAASVTYLLLLFIPARRLFINWRRVQRIRKFGLKKVDIRYRLFVKKITAHLGIRKNVGIYFSDLVKSPLTIGYLKPLVLLPLASVTNLSPQQVEAVLLHELSHIKRYDYLVNILVSIIHTLLYFNPFARFLIRVVQEERENCCDQTVLQFGYDKVSYASALLSLEKTSLHSQTFALGAAGKRNLLGRIEKIVGVEKKLTFQFHHFIGIMAALFCIVVFNSLLVASRQKTDSPVAFNNFANPFYFFEESQVSNKIEALPKKKDVTIVSIKKIKEGKKMKVNLTYPLTRQYDFSEPVPNIMQVAYKEETVKLSKEKEEHIKTTLENTKKVLATYEWTEVEKTIGDGLSPAEKAAVKQEYLREVKELDWENMEKNLQAAYENINWKEIDGSLNMALSSIRLDSLQRTCEQTLKSLSTLSFLPFPDESVDSLKKRELEVQTNLNQIKELKEKKVIKL
jgi:bla regulator protein blaR1